MAGRSKGEAQNPRRRSRIGVKVTKRGKRHAFGTMQAGVGHAKEGVLEAGCPGSLGLYRGQGRERRRRHAWAPTLHACLCGVFACMVCLRAWCGLHKAAQSQTFAHAAYILATGHAPGVRVAARLPVCEYSSTLASM
eukprot:363378-Chlamydomonas_euryale.AAC.4